MQGSADHETIGLKTTLKFLCINIAIIFSGHQEVKRPFFSVCSYTEKRRNKEIQTSASLMISYVISKFWGELSICAIDDLSLK